MKLKNIKCEVRPGDEDEVQFLVTIAQAIIHERYVVGLDRNEDGSSAAYTVSIMEFVPFTRHGFHLGAAWVPSEWGNHEKVYFNSIYAAHACYDATCAHLM